MCIRDRHNVQKEPAKSRIYQRESLGNFEKQLYESENQRDSDKSGSEKEDKSDKQKRSYQRRRNKREYIYDDKRDERRNFEKKTRKHKESIGENHVLERVMEKNNLMTERTVKQVLEHGEKNTKMLKEAFREFLTGFRKIDDSDDDGSIEPKRLRKLREDLEAEKIERRKLEKSVRDLKEGKGHMSGGYSTGGIQEDFEKKYRYAQRELIDAKDKTKELENRTKEMILEMEKLKTTVKNLKRGENDYLEKNQIESSDEPTEQRKLNKLPKYVYIKTVKSRYENEEIERRSSDRWENSTRRVSSNYFIDEFVRNNNKQMENFEREKFEKKLYKLNGQNTYEMLGMESKKRYKDKRYINQRRSKSLFGEKRIPEWRQEIKMTESEVQSRGKRSESIRLNSESSKRDIKLNKALELSLIHI